MTTLDLIVLAVYFMVLIGIGLASMRIKRQEDFLLGGRSFGVILQTFAAFGAGTGSQDIVTTSRTTYDNGLSGMWSIFQLVFVTPFYWFYGIWFRRMRHLTLGDWFVERFQSKAMGVAYTAYAIAYMLTLLGLNFLAVGKVVGLLGGVEEINLPWFGITVPAEYVVTPTIGLVVTVYAVLGGLRAAYWTDLLQGVCIMVLSVILIPAGLNALAHEFGDPEAAGVMEGFRVLHQQLPAESFEIFGSSRTSLFTLPYVVAITLMGLLGVAVQPFLISIGGGSAKSENAARIGLMAGTFMKRLCTIGWAMTTLIVVAMTIDDATTLTADPDGAWGVATQEILGPFHLGLVGLMAACLMAALMSSADCYMLAISGLVVRNVYAAYINPDASEKTYVLASRLAGIALMTAAVIVALWKDDLFEQVKMCWELPIIFIAPFWVGMFWRWTTKRAAWLTILFSTLAFFIIPSVLPMVMPSLAENPRYTATGEFVTTITLRPASPADVARREGAIRLWRQNVGDWVKKVGPQTERTLAEKFGPCPEKLELGKVFPDKFTTGGTPVYWKDGISVINEGDIAEPLSKKHRVEVGRSKKDNTVTIRERINPEYHLCGEGGFNLTLLLYNAVGIDLTNLSKATLETMRYAMRLILPFVVLILLSLITPRDDKQALDRFYVKMKTPVKPDPEADKAELEASYGNPSRHDNKRLFPFLGLEIQKFSFVDIAGFVVGFAICFSIIGIAVLLATLGS